jgi:hypothetical protein
VAVVRVNNPGAAILQVFDHGRLVAETAEQIAEPPKE